MLWIVCLVSLILSIANWAVFVFITFAEDIPQLKQLFESLTNPPASQPGGIGVTVQQSAFDPSKLTAATGSLAGAFKKAGSGPTAAAMSVMFLLLALVAAGVGKF